MDCGTNSTRLLVALPDGTTHVRLMRITRLGEGVDATGRLRPEAIDRTVRVLREYRRVMDEAGVTAARMVTTSAARDARNGTAFLDAAALAVRFPAELLSGEEEGRLAYAGATVGLPPTVDDDMVVDIGGGSTELVVRHGRVITAHSMDIGCVRLTERFLHHDPPAADELEAMVACIDEELEIATMRCRPCPPSVTGADSWASRGASPPWPRWNSVSRAYDSDKIHHSVLCRRAVDRWCATLAAQTSADRAARPGMVPGRADVIVGGAYVLKRVMEHFGIEECIASETDILDGIALSLLA